MGFSHHDENPYDYIFVLALASPTDRAKTKIISINSVITAEMLRTGC